MLRITINGETIKVQTIGGRVSWAYCGIPHIRKLFSPAVRLSIILDGRTIDAIGHLDSNRDPQIVPIWRLLAMGLESSDVPRLMSLYREVEEGYGVDMRDMVSLMKL